MKRVVVPFKLLSSDVQLMVSGSVSRSKLHRLSFFDVVQYSAGEDIPRHITWVISEDVCISFWAPRTYLRVEYTNGSVVYLEKFAIIHRLEPVRTDAAIILPHVAVDATLLWTKDDLPKGS